LAHPGTLPVANYEAIMKVVRFGLALGGKIRKFSHFSRKSYFYPDLPKAYQITQYDEPLVEGGELLGVRIKRVHLEEDTGGLSHAESGSSLVDYNRAGVPLMELVTEPDLQSAEDVVAFAKELQLIVRYTGVSNADMEKGEMRIEANVSLNMGTKVELKNINSFKAVGSAIAYELERHKEALGNGEKLIQETRGWDENKQVTFSQRTKEAAHDYRYFPEPDLPPVELSDDQIELAKRELPELPEARRERYKQEYGISSSQIEQLVSDVRLGDFFEQAVSEFRERKPDGDTRIVANYLLSDIQGLLNDKKLSFNDLGISPEHFGHFAFLLAERKLSSRLAKDLLVLMAETHEDPAELMISRNMVLMDNDDELHGIISKIVAENEKVVLDYRAGKEAALQFLIGQVMRETKGKAEPSQVRSLVLQVIEGAK